MTVTSGAKLAQTIVKNPAAGQILGYGLVGVGIACAVTGCGMIKVTQTLLVATR